MPLLNLIARLGLDSTGFNAELAKAEKTAAGFGAKFSRSIGATVGKFFTLGFAVDAAVGAIRKLEESNNSLDESFLRVPGQLLSDIEALQEVIGRSEKLLALKKAMATIDKEIFKEADQRFLKDLSNEDRRTELTRRRFALLQILKTASVPPLKAKEMQLETEKLLTQIGAIDVEKETTPKPEFQTRTFGETVRDPLARIGGFTGGSDVRIVSHLEKITRATQETADNTAGNTVGFR